MPRYKHFFGFLEEPFAQDIPISKLYPLPGVDELIERFDYVVGLRTIGIITGEIGSGKSTSLRLASSKYHSSEYKILPVIAHSGTVKEFLRHIAYALGMESITSSITTLLRATRTLISELTVRKQVPLLIIDEAHLLRPEVFAQIHTLVQFDFDSKPVMPLILCGQNQLLDKLHYHSSRALASRVVGRTHLEALDHTAMTGYLKHHLEIAGIKDQLFSEQAVLAIHQGSGGLLRKANILARGALICAARNKVRSVSPDHVRIASTEVI